MQWFGFWEIHLDPRIVGDGSRLPMALEIRYRKRDTSNQIDAGLCIAGVAWGFQSTDAAQHGLWPYLTLGLCGAGLAVAVLAVIASCVRRRVRIDQTGVEMAYRTLLGTRSWREPLSAFEGVRWREFRVQNRRAGSDRRNRITKVHMLDLKHPEPARCIPLYVSPRNGRWRDIWSVMTGRTRVMTAPDVRALWERTAKLLSLPAIDTRNGARQVRAPGDLNKSVKASYREGKLEPGRALQAAPAGLAYSPATDSTAPDNLITLHGKRFPVWLYAALGVAGVAMLFAGIMDSALIAILFGGLLLPAVMAHWVFETRNPRTIRITAEHIHLHRPMPGAAPQAMALSHDEIEHIAVATRADQRVLGPRLVFATDRGEFAFGSGLSREALVWLRGAILAAMVHPTT